MADAKAIVLLSGGLDSATTLAIARAERYACYALSFRYGRRHQREVDVTRRVAQGIGVVEQRVLDIDLAAFGGSALTDEQVAVPKDYAATGEGGTTPPTYVPARNTVLLSYALAGPRCSAFSTSSSA